MAVLLETSRGDIVIDLFVDDCPNTCRNFLKLCKVKYYNNCIFYNVQQNFVVQAGDPTGTGKGGTSVYGLMYGDQARFFDDELRPKLKHKAKGVVGMVSPVPNANASQFYITTGEDLQSLDGKHTIFGQVGEGLDVVASINEAFVDDAGRPLQNIRIRHTIVLDDPFDDPPPLAELIPPQSPEPQFEQGDRLEDDWVPPEDGRTAEEIEEETRAAEAHNRAVVLEMIGDLPEADAKPPTSVLFVCKLNPVTTEEDLEIIFSRFGHVVDCSIIRDFKTGDSLCYGFIGFDNDASCEEAYFKMNNVLIDDRRIKVDFSQSVAHLWKQFKRGGGRADAAMAKEASMHERDANGARDRLGSSQGRLEFKGQALPGAAGLPGRPAAESRLTLLLGDEVEDNARAAAALPPPLPQPHAGRGARPDRPPLQPPHGSREGNGYSRHDERHKPRGEERDGGRADDEQRGLRRGDAPSGRRDRERSRDRAHDRERHEVDRNRGRDRERDRGRDRERDRERDTGRVRSRERELERRQHTHGDHDRERGRDRDRERGRDDRKHQR